MRAMQPDARKQDVKRVFAFRESLLLIDLADPSAALLKGALLQCAVSPAFLVRNYDRPFLLLTLLHMQKESNLDLKSISVSQPNRWASH
jgi:hypothetical protein